MYGVHCVIRILINMSKVMLLTFYATKRVVIT